MNRISRLNRILVSLTLSTLLIGSGLIMVNQMSSPGMSEGGLGEEGPMPDLTIGDDGIHFSNDSPIEGEIIVITATIWNIGNETAREIAVDFYDHFLGTGRKIGRTFIAELGPGASANTSIEWVAEPAGHHGILVKVDPDNTILELREDNNVADRGIDVRPGETDLPDLTPGDIHFSNAHPKEGQIINICTVVRNIGVGVAENIEVRFNDIYNRTVRLIGTKFIGRLGANESAEVCHEWLAKPAGEHGIVVKVDPENKIAESDETNNVSDRGIVVEPLDGNNLYLVLVRFDNDGNRHLDDIVILVHDKDHNAVVGAEVYIDGKFYGRTPDTGVLLAYNLSHGWHVVKVHFNGVEVQKEVYSQG